MYLDTTEQILKGHYCPYCNCGTKLVSGEVIYPFVVNELPHPKYLDKSYHVCMQNPDHYVGTYADNVTSLGRLAERELRALKHQGHSVFDPLWKCKTHFKTQKDAYRWLSEKMNLPQEYTYFGMFTPEQCKQAIKFCNELNPSLSVG